MSKPAPAPHRPLARVVDIVVRVVDIVVRVVDITVAHRVAQMTDREGRHLPM